MRASHLLLTLALLAPTLAHAQEGSVHDRVVGRNTWLKDRLGSVARAVRPHVVKLEGGKAKGYGVVVKKGYVLTSLGVVGSAKTMQATDSEGLPHSLRVHAKQRKHGIAVLQFVDPDKSPAPIGLGSSEAVAIGQIVVACGTTEVPLAAGVVGAKGRPVDKGTIGGGGNVFLQLFGDGSNQGHPRSYPSVIHHDAPLEPEFFGSPLVDRKGRLIGINVAYPFRGSGHAVGLDTFRKALDDLLEGKSDESGPDEDSDPPEKPADPEPEQPRAGPRPYLGAGVAPATAEQLGKGHAFGLYVREIKPGGPAAQGKLQQGDVIVRLDGQPFASMEIFGKRFAAKRPGDTVVLSVLRGAAGIETQVKITVGAR